MANREHVRRLKQGVKAWNAWRRESEIMPDLREVNLVGANLGGADLKGADLHSANLTDANLDRAQLVAADLSNATLIGANLYGANLQQANLHYAELNVAHLDMANLEGADLGNAWLIGTVLRESALSGTILTNAILVETVFANVDLSKIVGLETCEHIGPSSVDFRTLRKSNPLPMTFLRGVGLADNLIDYLPSLLNQPIQHYSCFISYSTKDQAFADRLYADLQDKGVRCWFAPHDMPIGGKIWDQIDSAIRLRDRVLLILSENSIKSGWVEDEVTKAFEEERKHDKTVLFPIRLDDAVMDTNEPWAAKLRARHIGDFRRWKEHDEYQKSFERVLRDLTVKKP